MWAAANEASSLTKRFKCPFCSEIQNGEPQSSCWCGKQSFNIHNSDNPNACWNTCDRASKCPHGYPAELCEKPCHPGPCNSPCKANCPQPAEPVARGSDPATPGQPSCWTRFHERCGRRTPSTVSRILWLSLGLTIVYGLLAIFTSYHIRWRTQPYRFPRFAEKYSIDETVACMLVGMLFVAPVMFFLIMGLFASLGALLNDAMDLDSKETKRKRKFATQFFGTILLTILAGCILSLPIIGLAGGPSIAWYYQMRDSCYGYDTRIRMDKYDDTLKIFEMPAQRFNISSLTHNKHNQTFFLGPHLQPAYESVAPFQHYYRLTGTTVNNPHIAVDVDLENRQWRVLRLNNVDEANKFLSGQYETGSRQVPPFRHINESRIANGTFDKVSSNYTHMDLPQLDLRIANMHQFIDACEQEPFLRIYRTTNLREEEEMPTYGDKL